jgi:hypothetical protein
MVKLMDTYAILDNAGKVINTIIWDGVEFTAETEDTPAFGWSPPDGQTAVKITDATGNAWIGLGYANGVFEQPAAPPVVLPTPAETQAANLATQNALIATASSKIAIYTDATDPDLVDTVDPKDTAALKAWKQYRIAVNKVDLTQIAPAWPVAPQT